MNKQEHVIKFENISKMIDGNNILDSININVKSNSIVGLLGHLMQGKPVL